MMNKDAKIMNNIEINYNPPEFHVRGEWNVCALDSDHDWQMLLYDKSKTPMPAIAICTKCAKLEGGWAKDA